MDNPEDDIIPRLYQTQLEEIAVKKNSIIFLPTGSGKTYIAINLIKRLRHTLKKPWGEGGKRCFFLVNNVPLVAQQKKAIEQRCPVDGVGGFSGEDNVDYWKKDKFDSELAKYQVVVMTCQILNDMLSHQYIQLRDISLLIFDECHHAVEDHPMRLIMKHFQNCPKNEQPRVLGLTATLLNSNVKLDRIQETIRLLETTFQATVVTADDVAEVELYSTNPKEQLLYHSRPVATDAAMEATGLLRELQQVVMAFELPRVARKHDIQLKPHQKDMSSDPKKIIKAVSNMIESMIVMLTDLGVYFGALGFLANIVALERKKRWAASEVEELLYIVAITSITEARAVLLESMKDSEGYEKIIRYSSEKTLHLLDILKEYNPANISSNRELKFNQQRNLLCGLILTRERFTAKILYNFLKDVTEMNQEEFGFLKHDFLIGFNINPLSATREQHYNKKSSEQTLLKFKNGDLNCILATSVVEEGLDVPQCSLVLRYDAPIEYRSYIQSKGRARSKKANFVVLVDNENRTKFDIQYKVFKNIENYLNKIINVIGERPSPSDAEVKRKLYDDEEIPPYVTDTGAALWATSAINLLNRYCSMLPHDQYTKILPMVVQEPYGDGKTLVTIVMPIACSIKEPIKGLPMYTVKNAKRAAAMNVCIKLHKAGELDNDTLLPVLKGKIDFALTDVAACFPNWCEEKVARGEEGQPGTKKRVRKHPVHHPECLDGPVAMPTKCYLHVICLETAFDKPTDTRDGELYRMLRDSEGYGLITFEPLPELCGFPLFLTVGEVRTTLRVNYASFAIDRERFELIKRFHFFIFDQVLEVAKKFLVFDGRHNNLYVVPVKLDDVYAVNWSVIQTYKQIPPCNEPTTQERMTERITKEMYDNCVVTPWYRGNLHPDRYIVSRVLEYLTPYSKFEGDSFATYAEYYSNKYNLEILGSKDQPLLEVRNISSRMNCLLPRAASIHGLTDKQRRLASLAHGDHRPRDFAELFVPEFCVRGDYPALLWYKAIVLPSLLHRVTMLLISDELRIQILKETKKKIQNLKIGRSWLPIEVDLPVVKKSILSNIDEPTPINSVDRINNPIDETAQKPYNIVSLKESVYHLQRKKLSKNYPWDENTEPIDIERNLSRITVMDIECYDTFVTAPLVARNTISLIREPPRPSPPSAALLPPPLKYKDSIALLSLAPSPVGPEPRQILSALTVINSHDTFNLERAETLGDSFLKYAASLYLFHKFPKMDEGQLTNIKGRLIGNRNLYYAGERVGLAGRMKVEQFSPRSDFQVPGFLAPKELITFIDKKKIRPTFLIGVQLPLEEALAGKLSSESKSLLQEKFKDSDIAEEEPFGKAQNAMQRYIGAQAVSDKSVADCVEALIGTYLLSGGITDAISLLEWLKVIPPEDNFSSFVNKTVETVITKGKSTPTEIGWLLNSCADDIEKILGYKFKDSALLLEALSHASFIRNRLTRSYERLEFLGDAILDFLITSYIYENCGELSPGEVTDLRSALVNNVTFASYVVRLGLHKFICSQFNSFLESTITTFVEHQEQHDHALLEDVLYLIEEEDCQIAQYIDVPKVLSDIFESLTGAMYLDSGGDLSLVWRVIYRIMHKEIHAFTMKVPKQPVRVLMEMIHACPSFGKAKPTQSAVPKILIPVTFTRAGQRQTVYGVGGNKEQAKRAAAKLALKMLGA